MRRIDALGFEHKGIIPPHTPPHLPTVPSFPYEGLTSYLDSQPLTYFLENIDNSKFCCSTETTLQNFQILPDSEYYLVN